SHLAAFRACAAVTTDAAGRRANGFSRYRRGSTILFRCIPRQPTQARWIEGRNISIDIRWARPGDLISMPRFAKELIAVQPDLILSNTTPTTFALLQQTRSIPLVFAMVADPVGSGFVTSFAQPGGNATGFVTTEATLGGKWVDLLKDIAPNVVRM